MITRAQGLTTWGDRWRTLRAWKRSLVNVKVEISDRHHAGRLGTCWSHEQRIVIYRGESFIDELGTLVHELAHAATIGADHDARWQETFANAVTEITNIPVVPMAFNYRILNMAAKDAMRIWWKASGNATIWNLARGLAP
jgi:hypothetical protein